MQSRKSSILKPRKIREPLQDLNQLLPNNEDEETTTTDAQKRRVSFASMNKVKEFETASQCVTVITTPSSFDKHVYFPTDQCPPSVIRKNVFENLQVTNVSRKSVQSTFKFDAIKHSTVKANVPFVEDLELTETTGRIYDIPMKNSSDSSMEMTHVITQTEIHFEENNEEVRELMGPLNLTKENTNETNSFADAHIVEIEIVDKNEKDTDTSSMETTEVIINNIVNVQKPDINVSNIELTEIVSNSMKTDNENTSNMETTEIIYDNIFSDSIKSRSMSYETLQSSHGIDASNHREHVEYVSIRDFETQNHNVKRKSIFELSIPRICTEEDALLATQNHENVNYGYVGKLLLNQNKSIAGECSLSLTCEDAANKPDDTKSNVQILTPELKHELNMSQTPIFALKDVNETTSSSDIKTSAQEIADGTKYDILSMQLSSQQNAAGSLSCNFSLLSQRENDHNMNLNKELLRQEDRTKCNNSAMELLTQSFDKEKRDIFNLSSFPLDENKTEYVCSSMQFPSQDENLQLETANHNPECRNVNTPAKTDATSVLSTVNFSKIISPLNISANREFSCRPVTLDDPSHKDDVIFKGTNENSDELCDRNEIADEVSLKSTFGNEFNDSNSPLTVGVNFSIFQKNKETRVEFCGTIDSNKKKKSISNVKVNIIDNKPEKQCKHVKELRFSMPAATKDSYEPESKKSDFAATFTDFTIPNDTSVRSFDDEAKLDPNTRKCSSNDLKMEESTSVIDVNTFNDNNEKELNAQLRKSAKKRPSIETFFDYEESKASSKRRSLSHEVNDSNVAQSVEVENNASAVCGLQHNFTEVKQRKESFIRDDKSVVVDSSLLVETCSRSTNMNTGYETRQSIIMPECEEKDAEGSKNEHLNPETIMSCSRTDCDVKANVMEQSQEDDRGKENDLSSNNDDIRNSPAVNQSTPEEEIIDYSLHNPSIIVNIGDSFLGIENVSMTDVGKLPEENPEIKPIVDSDDISKENFVVEWLQNKKYKMSGENRFFGSSTDSTTSSILTNIPRVLDKPNIINIAESVRSPRIEKNFEAPGCLGKKDEVTVAVDPNQNNFIGTSENNNTNTKSDIIFKGEDTSIADSNVHTTGILLCTNFGEKIEISGTDNNEKKKVNSGVNVECTIPISIIEPLISISAETMTSDVQKEVKNDAGQIENPPIVANLSANCDEEKENCIKTALVSHENYCDLNCVNKTFNESKVKFAKEKSTTPSEEFLQPKLISKTRLFLDSALDNCQSTSEKRQKMSPEFEIDEINSKNLNRSQNNQKSFSVKENNMFQHSHISHEMMKADILTKIKLKSGNKKWKLKVVSDNEWIFRFFFDQLELSIKFNNEAANDACNASCNFVHLSQVKYYEISKIAAEFLIRKNRSKMKRICRSAEDIPYLLELIEPDVDYMERFVADILRLCDTEIFSIKNGRAVFYIYSLNNQRSTKIQVNLSSLEKLSVSDIKVEEIVGKTDINLVKTAFAEAGRDSNFFSVFVKKLWKILNE